MDSEVVFMNIPITKSSFESVFYFTFWLSIWSFYGASEATWWMTTTRPGLPQGAAGCSSSGMCQWSATAAEAVLRPAAPGGK